MNSPDSMIDLDVGRTWLNRAAAALVAGEDSSPDAVAYGHAAAMIGHGFVGLAHTARSFEAMADAATLTARQIDDEVDQPDGIASDSHDLPDAARASERVNAFLAWWGDGRIGEDVMGAGPPLFARDLQALANAAVPRG